MYKDKHDFATTVEQELRKYFTDAQGYWVYTADLCPGCGVRPIDEMIYQGKRALSINGFMYRERGILIGYLLCGECAGIIMKMTKYAKSPLHVAIEQNLIDSYQQYITSLDA